MAYLMYKAHGYIVPSNDYTSHLYDIGNYIIVFVTYDTTPPSNINAPNGVSDLANYITDWDKIGGNTIISPTTSETNRTGLINKFANLAPLSFPSQYAVSTNLIKFVFESGRYAISPSLSASGALQFTPYNSDGTAITGIPRIQFNYSSMAVMNETFCGVNCYIWSNFDNGKLSTTATMKYMTVSGHSAYIYFTNVSSSNSAQTANFFANEPEYVIRTDPYAGDGMSETGGGGGAYEYPYDIVEMPEYDSVETVKRGYANRGFLTVFSPTETEIQNFKSYLFSSSADATIKKMYQSPIEAIVSFAMVPYPVATLDTTSRIYLGGTDTGVDSHLVQYQFITVDFGTLDIEKATRSFNDFSPRTEASIYLPYIGVHELDIDKIMGYQIGLKYYIDIVSGDFIAYLTLNGALDAGTPEYEAMIDSGLQSGVIGQWAGNCLIHIPISSLDFSSRIGATIGLMGSAIGAVGASAVGSPVAPLMLSQLGTMANQALDIGKVTVKHKCPIPCTTGWLGIQKPYIMLSRPRLSIPENNNTLVGYPTNVYFILSDLSGYTEVQDIHLENVNATSDELEEIVSLLEGGVII